MGSDLWLATNTAEESLPDGIPVFDPLSKWRRYQMTQYRHLQANCTAIGTALDDLGDKNEHRGVYSLNATASLTNRGRGRAA